MDNELKYNGSKYYDETAYKALKKIESEENKMKQGEIWEIETAKGYETAVVISVHDRFCNVLILNDEQRHENEIEVFVRTVMYTNPCMLYYKYNSKFTRYIRTMDMADFSKIMHCIIEKLNLCEYCFEVIPKQGNESTEELEKALETIKVLQEKLNEAENKEAHQIDDFIASEFSRLKTELTVAEAQRDVFKSQYEAMLKKLIER